MDEILTLKEVAHRFCVSPRTVLRWTQRGSKTHYTPMPVYQHKNGVWLFSDNQIREWLDSEIRQSLKFTNQR